MVKIFSSKVTLGSSAFKSFLRVALAILVIFPVTAEAQYPGVSGTYEARVSEILDIATRGDREVVNRWTEEAQKHLARAREHFGAWREYARVAASERGMRAAVARTSARAELEQALIEYSAAAEAVSHAAVVYSNIDIGGAAIALDRARVGVLHLKDASDKASFSSGYGAAGYSPAPAAIDSAEKALYTAVRIVVLAADAATMEFMLNFGARFPFGPESAFARIKRIADGLEEGEGELAALGDPRQNGQSESIVRTTPIFSPTTFVYGLPGPYGGSVLAQLLAFSETQNIPNIAELSEEQAAAPFSQEARRLWELQPSLSESTGFYPYPADVFSQRQEEKRLNLFDKLLRILREFYKLFN
jgi:hypothetical protein